MFLGGIALAIVLLVIAGGVLGGAYYFVIHENAEEPPAAPPLVAVGSPRSPLGSPDGGGIAMVTTVVVGSPDQVAIGTYAVTASNDSPAL